VDSELTKKSALTLVDIEKRYSTPFGVVKALDCVTLTLQEGGFYCLMGPSGSGKTTLLLVSAGLLRPESGSACLFGDELYQGISLKTVRKTAAYMFQENMLIETLSIEENVELPLIIRGDDKILRKKIVSETLREVGIDDLFNRRPSEVSGGEKRRASLARCLVSKPRILFLDEPTSSLDSKTALDIISLLKVLQEKGTTIVMSTHDQYIAGMMKDILYLRDGKIVSG